MNLTSTYQNSLYQRFFIFFAIGLLLWITLLLCATGQSTSAAPTAATYSIIKDNENQKTVQVSGSGSTVTLADIQAGVAQTDTTFLVNSGSTWQLNVNLIIGKEVTLNLSPSTGVTELRLRSEDNSIVTQAQRITDSNAPDSVSSPDISYRTFVYLKAESGTINIDNITVTSWDPAIGGPDKDEGNGRAYLLAKYASTMNIRNADVGYLGAKDGESYGISWRDVGEENDEFITRVTGEVLNSQIHHNYYGIYTYQAQNMVFRGNEFYENIRYGFDPHDYSHHFIVEENVARDNGAHGFIISRGCNNFVFRNNKSYNNYDPGSNLAHGFMLDPGGANIDKPQVSSSENLLENNEAYDNEGYGIRILGSSDNTLRNNDFYRNEKGISVEDDSDRNLFQANRVTENERYGVYAENNEENEIRTNVIRDNGDVGIEIRKAHVMQIVNNTVDANQGHGIDISDGAKNNAFISNVITNNQGYGIKVSGSSSTGNYWSQNVIAGNRDGGIDDRVGKLAPPELTSATATRLEGRAKASATVEIFANDSSVEQGARYVGSATVDGSGNFSYGPNGGWNGTYLTAIALDQNGNASAFSAPIQVSGTTPPTPTSSATASTTATATPQPTVTATMTLPIATPTPSRTPTLVAVTETATPIATATNSATPTPTATATDATATPTVTSALSPTPTDASTPSGTGSTERVYLPFVAAEND